MPCMQYALPVTDGPVLSPAPPPAEDPEHECGGEEEAGAQDGGDQRQQQQLSRARTCKCVSVLGHCYLLYNVATSSVLQTIHRFHKSVFTITEAFSWVKVPNSAFTFKTLC